MLMKLPVKKYQKLLALKKKRNAKPSLSRIVVLRRKNHAYRIRRKNHAYRIPRKCLELAEQDLKRYESEQSRSSHKKKQSRSSHKLKPLKMFRRRETRKNSITSKFAKTAMDPILRNEWVCKDSYGPHST